MTGKSSLGHVPIGERWTFDDGVTDVFPDMLKRSIPQFDTMRRAVFELGSRFVQPGTDVVDLGCSLGDSLAPFLCHFGAANRYCGVEVSAPMLKKLQQRFAAEITSGLLRICCTDLVKAYPAAQASLTLSILTLQFVPVQFRARIVQDIYESTAPGGALILVEKIAGSTPELDKLMITLYHALKHANGYSWDEIGKKSLALENVLIPLPSSGNEELLKRAGFVAVDCFWRWMNFAGYIAIKGQAPALQSQRSSD